MIFRYESFIPAPLACVFAFHESPGALDRLIPPWETVRIIKRGESLAPGTRVVMEMKIGPFPIIWEALHTRYEKNVFFEDTQQRGPFSRWVHTHRFVAVEGGTVLIDEINYALPLGALGQLLGGFAVRKQLARMFRFRHEVTRKACLDELSATPAAPPIP